MTGDPDREGGYIKLHRKWNSSPTVKALGPLGQAVWIQLMFAANWKDTTPVLRRDGSPLVVKRGQALISERILAERAGVSRKAVRTALQTLTLAGSIEIERIRPRGGPMVSVVKVLKYDELQGDDTEQGPTSGPKESRTGAAGDTDQKKGKKGKKGKKKDHGGVGENGSLLATPPSLPPGSPPLAGWLVEHYPDVEDPAGFARLQADAHPHLDLVAEARKAFAWERSEPRHAKQHHGRFLSNWFNRAAERTPSNGARGPAVAADGFCYGSP